MGGFDIVGEGRTPFVAKTVELEAALGHDLVFVETRLFCSIFGSAVPGCWVVMR
jgi:hypothetical protein